MSDEQQEIFGKEAVEASQGWSQMVPASPVTPEEEPVSESLEKHLTRNESVEPISREYHDPDGSETPEHQSVSLAQASHDIGNARRAEAEALEAEGNRQLAEALDTLHQQESGQQPAPDQLQPELEVQPDAFQDDFERAQQLHAQADRELEEALKSPVIRERIAAELSATQTQARQEVESVKQQYAAAVNGLSQEIGYISAALFPEIAGMSPEQARGALAVMQQTDPRRVEQIVQFANKVQGIAQQQQQLAHAQQQAQTQRYQESLAQYTEAETRKYEQMIADDSPDTQRAVRENVGPFAEKYYGVSAQTLRAIHDGKMQISGTELVRSSSFQKIFHDAIKYQMSKQSINQARDRTAPKVQRPSFGESPRVLADDGELAAASARLNLPGGNIGLTGLRNAAALVSARRARGG